MIVLLFVRVDCFFFWPGCVVNRMQVSFEHALNAMPDVRHSLQRCPIASDEHAKDDKKERVKLPIVRPPINPHVTRPPPTMPPTTFQHCRRDDTNPTSLCHHRLLITAGLKNHGRALPIPV